MAKKKAGKAKAPFKEVTTGQEQPRKKGLLEEIEEQVSIRTFPDRSLRLICLKNLKLILATAVETFSHTKGKLWSLTPIIPNTPRLLKSYKISNNRCNKRYGVYCFRGFGFRHFKYRIR